MAGSATVISNKSALNSQLIEKCISPRATTEKLSPIISFSDNLQQEKEDRKSNEEDNINNSYEEEVPNEKTPMNKLRSSKANKSISIEKNSSEKSTDYKKPLRNIKNNCSMDEFRMKEISKKKNKSNETFTKAC